MEKTVIILRGLPGSGKTSFLHHMGPHVHISMDLFWTKDGGEYAFDYTRLKEAIEWVQAQYIKALDTDSNIPIVVDNVSYLRIHYEVFLKEARARNIPVHVIHVERPIAECIAANTHKVPAEKIVQMARDWEPVNQNGRMAVRV